MKLVGIVATVGFAVIMASCSNADLESRITKLEGRIAAMEGSGAATSSASSRPAPAINNTPTPPAEKPEGPLPAFKFEKEVHDFGTIMDGDVVEHVFKFTNTGEIPLIISDAKATCGCTVPEKPTEPIPVGGTGDIKVRFNSKGKPGVQNKTITLTANTWPTTHRLRIKANVEKAAE
ncbi:MAG: DUF1573 domain-containing protein [Bacteroidota bacterium]